MRSNRKDDGDRDEGIRWKRRRNEGRFSGDGGDGGVGRRFREVGRLKLIRRREIP